MSWARRGRQGAAGREFNPMSHVCVWIFRFRPWVRGQNQVPWTWTVVMPPRYPPALQGTAVSSTKT